MGPLFVAVRHKFSESYLSEFFHLPAGINYYIGNVTVQLDVFRHLSRNSF